MDFLSRMSGRLTDDPQHLLDVGWKVIQETLSNVYAELAEMPPEMGGSGDGGGVSGGVGRTPLKTSYSEAYGNCFRMCSGRAPYNVSPQVYGRYTEAVSEYLSGTVLASLAELQGAELLRALKLCWKKLGILLHFYLKRIFTYLDRFYVGCYGKHSIEDAFLNSFRTEVFSKIETRVVEAVQGLLLDELAGRAVDYSLLRRSAVQVSIAISPSNHTIYRQSVQLPVLCGFLQREGARKVEDIEKAFHFFQRAEAGLVKPYTTSLTTFSAGLDAAQAVGGEEVTTSASVSNSSTSATEFSS